MPVFPFPWGAGGLGGGRAKGKAKKFGMQEPDLLTVSKRVEKLDLRKSKPKLEIKKYSPRLRKHTIHKSKEKLK